MEVSLLHQAAKQAHHCHPSPHMLRSCTDGRGQGQAGISGWIQGLFRHPESWQRRELMIQIIPLPSGMNSLNPWASFLILFMVSWVLPVPRLISGLWLKYKDRQDIAQGSSAGPGALLSHLPRIIAHPPQLREHAQCVSYIYFRDGFEIKMHKVYLLFRIFNWH